MPIQHIIVDGRPWCQCGFDHVSPTEHDCVHNASRNRGVMVLCSSENPDYVALAARVLRETLPHRTVEVREGHCPSAFETLDD